MRGSQIEQGFTLIEFAVVVLISGIMLAAVTEIYATYVVNQRYVDTENKLATIQSSLGNYSAARGRLPFPSDPSLPIGSTNAGCECGSCVYSATACNALINLPLNKCIGGICKVGGFRLTAANLSTAVNPKLWPGNDPVYIGGVPYKSIVIGMNTFASGPSAAPECYKPGTDPAVPANWTQCDPDSLGTIDSGLTLLPTYNINSYTDVNMTSTVDDYGFQLGYAVSGGSTSATTYEQGVYGVIDVTTEPPGLVDLTSPAGSMNYVLISYGDNHMGAYSTGGVIPVPCVMGTVDYANCNHLPGAQFIDGLRSMAPGTAYFDDILQYSPYNMTMLWNYTQPGSGNTSIDNQNVGYVGVGTTTPTQELDVNGSMSVSGNVTATLICDSTGANCWAPNLLAGPLTGSNASNNLCPAAPAGYMNVVTNMGIGATAGQVQCTTTPMALVPAPLGQSCATGVAYGFSATTGLLCH